MKLFNKLVVSTIPVFPKKFVRLFANKYIAGDNLGDAVKTVQTLNSKGFCATMDVLGELISDRNEAVISKDENLEVLDAIGTSKLDCNLSVKLTMLGLGIDNEFCYSQMNEILSRAKEKNIFVRIDMEDSGVTQNTLDIFNRLRKDFNNVGIVIQAYLRRSEDDIKILSSEKVNFRICKGIYIEPESVAYKGFQEIRENFLKILRIALENGSYCGIATHDDYIVEGAKKITAELELSNDKFEFQMLLGVKENLRDRILQEGYKVRVYVPFGQRWYEYSTRRFKENPDVAGHVIKSILGMNK